MCVVLVVPARFCDNAVEAHRQSWGAAVAWCSRCALSRDRVDDFEACRWGRAMIVAAQSALVYFSQPVRRWIRKSASESQLLHQIHLLFRFQLIIDERIERLGSSTRRSRAQPDTIAQPSLDFSSSCTLPMRAQSDAYMLTPVCSCASLKAQIAMRTFLRRPRVPCYP